MVQDFLLYIIVMVAPDVGVEGWLMCGCFTNINRAAASISCRLYKLLVKPGCISHAQHQQRQRLQLSQGGADAELISKESNRQCIFLLYMILSLAPMLVVRDGFCAVASPTSIDTLLQFMSS